jgi:hypothetical protein
MGGAQLKINPITTFDHGVNSPAIRKNSISERIAAQKRSDSNSITTFDIQNNPKFRLTTAKNSPEQR